MSRPPRTPGGRPPGGGRAGGDAPPPTGPRPPARRIREPAGGSPLATSPREANRRANHSDRPMLKRPEPGSESNPFGGRPVKVPRSANPPAPRGGANPPAPRGGANPAAPRARANSAPRRERGAARAEAAAAPGTIEPQRIAKLLARAGVGSRRDIERFITEGRVAINGTVLTTPAHILSSLDGVTVNGDPVAAIEATRLFRFHKPSGFLTTARDPGGRPTIFDALPKGLPRLVPVGRLDMNTEGLLLLTTDGALKRTLELPLNAVSRRYRVRAYGEVTQAILEGLIEGIEIDGMRYGPINADIERRTGRNLWLTITLTEGKNREIRRVLEFLGLQVSRLIRVAYGPFELGDLGARMVEEIDPGQIEALRRSIAKKDR
ncbi:MAG: pseudouridine synthase [Janthinobacterium lividum]